MTRKTDAERANINARASFTDRRSLTSMLDTLMVLQADNHYIERETLAAFGRKMRARGWTAGVKDANGEDE